jgi:hypothetical protein
MISGPYEDQPITSRLLNIALPNLMMGEVVCSCARWNSMRWNWSRFSGHCARSGKPEPCEVDCHARASSLGSCFVARDTPRLIVEIGTNQFAG